MRRVAGVLITCVVHVMFSHPPIFFVEEIQRLPIERQIRIVDAVRKFPALGIQVDFNVGGLAGDDVRDEVVILVLLVA